MKLLTDIELSTILESFISEDIDYKQHQVFISQLEDLVIYKLDDSYNKELRKKPKFTINMHKELIQSIRQAVDALA